MQPWLSEDRSHPLHPPAFRPFLATRKPFGQPYLPTSYGKASLGHASPPAKRNSYRATPLASNSYSSSCAPFLPLTGSIQSQLLRAAKHVAALSHLSANHY